MDVSTAQILFGKVMHQRTSPKKHGFTYRHYNLVIPLEQLESARALPALPVDQFGLLSFYRKDHGNRQDGHLKAWLLGILKDHEIDFEPAHINLVTMPRVLGYVFNPVSFWLCFDEDKTLRAVLCEVNNTFGETHSYLCHHADFSEITSDQILKGQKLFHVSPFLQREGTYHFRFALEGDKLGIFIDHYDEAGRKLLLTSLTGKCEPLDKAALRRAFWRYPLITFMAIARIHLHALKLIFKGIRYIPKPLQLNPKTSQTD